MNIPNTLNINGYTFEVNKMNAEEVKDNPNLAGYMDGARCAIVYRKDPEYKDTYVADTVLHEAMHAILYTQGRSEKYEVEERFVRALATGLIGAFAANPGLLSMIDQAVRDAS